MIHATAQCIPPSSLIEPSPFAFDLRMQQDGPNSHILPDDALFNEGLEEQGVQNKVLLYTQPANSPDLNINDLALFRALQSAYEEFTPSNADDIIKYVMKAYNEYPTEKINRMWITMQSCMNQIIEHHGNNNYSIPHLKKERLSRFGNLPVSLPVTDAALNHLG